MIHLTMGFSNGRRIEAVLLSLSSDEMRVAVPGQTDALCFRRVDGEWTSEDGERIELESIVRLEEGAANEKQRPRVAAATQGFRM